MTGQCRRQVRRYTTGEAVADALDAVSHLIRSGVIVGFSCEWHPTGTARVAYTIAPGIDCPELELAGTAEEEDERG